MFIFFLEGSKLLNERLVLFVFVIECGFFESFLLIFILLLLVIFFLLGLIGFVFGVLGGGRRGFGSIIGLGEIFFGFLFCVIVVFLVCFRGRGIGRGLVVGGCIIEGFFLVFNVLFLFFFFIFDKGD